jgi:hypothetical protein
MKKGMIVDSYPQVAAVGREGGSTTPLPVQLNLSLVKNFRFCY